MRSSRRRALWSLLWPGSGCIWVTPGQIYLCVGVSLCIPQTQTAASHQSSGCSINRPVDFFLLCSIGGRIWAENRNSAGSAPADLCRVFVLWNTYTSWNQLAHIRHGVGGVWGGLRRGFQRNTCAPPPTHPPILLHLVSISSCGTGRSGFPQIMPLFSLYVSFPHVAIVHWPH